MDVVTRNIKINSMDPFQVILGGGRRTFLPSGTRDDETKHLNKRLDRRNMIEVRYKMGSKLDYYELNAVFKSSALFGVYVKKEE